MSQFNSFSPVLQDIEQDTLINGIDTQHVSPFMKKLINTTYTAATMQNIVEYKGRQKALNLNGFETGSINMSDADSGIYYTADGQQRKFRFANMDKTHIDAVDKQANIYSSLYKAMRQPSFVAKLSGKSVQDLTDADFNNVYNYQVQQIKDSFTNKDYKFTPYDSAQSYNSVESNAVPFAYKVIGQDEYGRDLIEAVNPATGRQVSFDMSNNPFLNASFDLYKALETKEDKSNPSFMDKLSEVLDTDNRLLEDIDLVQSNAYQSAARVLQHLPESVVDVEHWKAVANAETGQALADAYTGVNPRTRKEYASNMLSASEAFKQGNYVEAITGIVSNFDRMLADSAVQSGLMAVGATIGAPLGIAGAAMGGAFLAAGDATLANIEEYKVNNNGKEMSGEEIAKAFALNVATLIPETLIVGMNVTRFLPKSISKALTSTYKSGAVTDAGKTVVKSFAGEAAQEAVQGTVERYVTQNQENAKSITDLFFSPDTGFDALAGGIMGGGLSGIGAGTTLVPKLHNETARSALRDTITKTMQSSTPLRTEANVEVSSNVVAQANKLEIPTTATKEEAIATLKELESLKATKDLSIEAIEAIDAKGAELLKQAIISQETANDAKHFIELLEKDTEEVFEEVVYHSGLHDDTQFIKSGKELTDEAKALIKQELTAVGQKLGLSLEQINKSFDTVNDEIRSGWKGYKNYDAQITAINNKLNNTSLTDEERQVLLEDRERWVGSVLRLANSQATKLAAFADAFSSIALDNKTKVHFNYASNTGKGFTVYAKDIASHSFNDDVGALRMIHSIHKDLKAMNAILAKVPSDTISQITAIGGEYAYDATTVTSVMNRLQRAASIIRAKADKEVKASNNILSTAQKLAKVRDKGKEDVGLIATLRNAPDSELEAVKNSTEDIAVKNVISYIQQMKKETVEEQSSFTDRDKALETTANKLISTYTDDVISSFSDINSVRDIYKTVRTTILALQEDLSDKHKETLSKLKKLQENIKQKGISLHELSNLPVEIKEDVQVFNDTAEVAYTEDNGVVIVKEPSTTLVSRRVLNKEFNQSLTLSAYGTNYDLTKEITASDAIGCKLAIASLKALGISEQDTRRFTTWFKNVFDNANKLTINWDNTDIKSPASYILGSVTTNGLLDSCPHYRLLYNMTIKKETGKPNSIEFKFNPVMLAVLGFSVEEFLASSNLSEILSPSTDYDIASCFTLNSEDLSKIELNELRQFVDQHGVTVSAISDRLGRLILNNAGITVNKQQGNVAQYDRLASGLGLYAIQYMAQLGYVNVTNVSEHLPSKLRSQSISMIKFTGKSVKSIRDNYLGSTSVKGFKELFKNEDASKISEPRIEKAKLPRKMHLRNSMGLMNVSAYVKHVLSKLWNVEYEINIELADFIKEHRDSIAKKLGYTDKTEFTYMSRDMADSAEGINKSIDTQLDYFLKYAEEFKTNKKPYMFNWFVSKNGRLFMDSTTLNPQTGKEIQRFLCMPSNIKRVFNPTNDEHIKAEAFAIAQAFDALGTDKDIAQLGETFNNFTVEQLKQLQLDIATMSNKEFAVKYSKYGFHAIENFGQSLNVVQHLIRKKEANGKSFETWLAVENDSTTSGYFLRMLQFPITEVLAKFGTKVGIIEENSNVTGTSMHGLKKTEGFLDIYKTTAQAMADFIPDINTTGLSDYFKKSSINANELTILYRLMHDALPAMKDGKVSKELRTLMKDPTMTFGYTAGSTTIKRNLSEKIMFSFIETYLDIKRNGTVSDYLANHTDADANVINAVYKTMSFIDAKLNNTLESLLKTKYIKEIQVPIGNKTVRLDVLFNEVLAPTYGEAVWQALSRSFAAYIPYNNAMNQMFVSMFKMFDKLYEKGMKDLREQYPDGVPIKEHDKLVDSLFDVWPTLRLAYSESRKEGMLLMKTARAYNKQYQVQNATTVDGKLETISTYANVKEFVNAGKAGSVLPIHFLDGMVMAMVLDKYPNVIPVHDAIVMSALDNKAITQEYNNKALQTCANFNVFEELVNRFVSSVEVYDKLAVEKGLPKFIQATEIHNAYGQQFDFYALEPKDAKLKWSGNDFIYMLSKLVAKNNEARKQFYSQTLTIANMDGIDGSSVTVTVGTRFDNQDAFDEAITKWRGYSDPSGYTYDGDLETIISDANDTVEGRLSVFDKLQSLANDLGNKIENTEHLQHLKSLLKKINPDATKDLIIKVEEGKAFNAGMLSGDVVTIGFQKAPLDLITRLSPLHGKSGAEIYAHELVHAGLRFALANNKMFGINSLVNQLMDVQKAAMESITWEDFMPDSYDSSLQEMYEEQAKQLWDYIFNHNDTVNLTGLHEFCAYGLTNEKLMNKLKSIEMPIRRNKQGKVYVLDRLISIAKAIYDIVFGTGRTAESLQAFKDAWTGTVSLREKRTLYAELDRLTTAISGANIKAYRNLFYHPMRVAEYMFKFLGTVRSKGNELVSPWLKRLFNLMDDHGYKANWTNRITDNNWVKAAKVAGLVTGFAFSASRRKAFKEWLIDISGMTQQSVAMSMLRDLSEPDLQTARLDMISALTRQQEQCSKALEATAFAELSEKFGRTLNDAETHSLTTSCLYTDLQCLLEDNNFATIKELLQNNEAVSEAINKINTELKKERYYKWYRNQALGLAYYMVSGIGNECQNLNAENIVRGFYSGITMEYKPELVEKVNKLATLYALMLTPKHEKQLAASLSDEGITNFLITHKQFVKESKEGVNITDPKGNPITVQTLNSLHAIKGYTKSLIDTSYDIRTDLVINKEQLAKEGFELIRVFGSNNVTQNNGIALYRRSFATPRRRDGAAFMMAGANSLGTSLKDTAYMLSDNLTDINQVSTQKLVQQYQQNADITAKKLAKMMFTKELTIKELSENSSGYTPILNPETLLVSDYRITMSVQNKINDLHMNTNGLHILSKMYASQNTKANADIRNRILIRFLKEDVQNNMNMSTLRDIHGYGYKYIQLTPNSSNKFLRDAWACLPRQIQDEVNSGEPFYVREDWLQSLLGTPSGSINDLDFVKKHGNKVTQRMISISEYVLKCIAYLAKQNIIIRVPAVLLGNIISNFNYSVMNGTNPIKVGQKTLENAKAIRDYVNTKRELNRILFKQRLGTATSDELAKINWYTARLEHSQVHPLMEKGMYQAIVEDINPDDLESIGQVQKLIKNNKFVQRIPSAMRTALKHLYATEGTPLYDFMFQATQYSDFVARATEYQILMEKAPKKYEVVKKNGKTIRQVSKAWAEYEEKATIQVWNAFINYDKPQSTVEQYFNDLGLVMFTKFAKRIQHVIAKGTIDNPIGTLMFILGQSFILDTEDIMEQNVFNKHWSSLVHSPLDNIINAVTPMYVQYATGMRNLSL